MIIHTETVFDSVQLQTSNIFLVVQLDLIGTASIWFDFRKSDLCDWATLKHQIREAFQPSCNPKLSEVTRRQPAVHHHSSSSTSLSILIKRNNSETLTNETQRAVASATSSSSAPGAILSSVIELT
ncbi:unnamed protein product [Rotaria magnacalcarata]|uniref:Uncharacterized protein n=2 Tax=Rotaria magnacalcarata TaxID=392030 RepID=A0A816ANK6_9BILA|nr:unnamed protein product [Rotaria magnacalcarata]CAF3923219.1 unnamed protein product [Rotaria magnacalcarata]